MMYVQRFSHSEVNVSGRIHSLVQQALTEQLLWTTCLLGSGYTYNWEAKDFLRMKVKSVSYSVVSNCLQPHGLYSTRFLCPWNSPGKNTGEDSHSLLQGIFPTQGSNPDLLHCRQILYHVSHEGSPFNVMLLSFTFYCSPGF